MKILITRNIDKTIEQRLQKQFDCVMPNADNSPMEKAQIIKLLADCEVILPNVTDQIDSEIIDAGEKLGLIANFGVGTNNIDLKHASDKNITVTNTPGVLSEDTADTAIALMLSSCRRLYALEKTLREGKWTGWTPTWKLGTKVSGKRLGIVGMGRIGQEVAKRALGFSMEIHYHNRKQLPQNIEENLQARFWSNLDEMLASTDIITLHCPASPETTNLINARRLGLMQKSSVLINTARGDVIDEQALITALKSKTIAAAGLDVYPNEPYVNPELIALENVTLLPHIGSGTTETRLAMASCVADNIEAWAQQKEPPNKVV